LTGRFVELVRNERGTSAVDSLLPADQPCELLFRAD
jgi:hypothetical protein